MEQKNTNLKFYAIIGALLMVFGFYSSTILHASALESYTFNMSYSDLRGGKYSSTEGAWWFVSTNNNTALKLPNNTTNPTSYPVNTNFNCADPQNILPLEYAGGLYYAVWCDNGVVASNGLMIRDQTTNEEKDFESNIFNTEQGFAMAEWVNGHKLYVVNHGSTSQQLAIFNLQAINSTTSTMLVEVKNLSSQCAVVFDMVIDNENARAFISCQRITSNVMTIAVFDLLGSVVSEYITLSGVSATLNLDYNPITEQVIATSYGNNDIFVVDVDSSTVVQQNLSFCSSGSPLSPTYNENTNQVYILCNTSATGANAVTLYDVEGNNTVSTFVTPNSVTGVQGGSNNWALIDFYSDIGYLYGAFGHVQNTGSGAGVNRGVIVIYDDSDVPTDPDNPSGGGQTNGRCNNGTALECVGDRSVLTQVTGGQSWTGLGNSLFGGIGLVNTTANSDPQTNGTGLLLMLMLGTFFASIVIGSISVANNKFGAGISYTEIPKEFWLFLVVGVIAVSYYLEWIPDVIFYSMIVGIIGLFSFGLYKHIRGG